MKLQMDTTLSASDPPKPCLWDQPVESLEDMDCICTHNMKYCIEQKGLYSIKALAPFFSCTLSAPTGILVIYSTCTYVNRSEKITQFTVCNFDTLSLPVDSNTYTDACFFSIFYGTD